MAEYEPIQIRASYRAPSHLPIWQLMLACDIWPQVGIVYLASPTRGQASPLAVWDLHYLREPDASGFIDGLYAEQPAAVGSASR
jgi:hypothetical protein